MSDAYLWACQGCRNVIAMHDRSDPSGSVDCPVCGVSAFTQLGGVSR